MTKLDEKVYLSVGVVAILIGTVFSFGVIYQKVENVTEWQSRIDERLARIENVLLKPIAIAGHHYDDSNAQN